jgi:hypothetical protein
VAGGLRRRSTAARMLLSWVRIPSGVWMFVYCVLSGSGLGDEPITRPEDSYRLWRVVVCDQETSWNEEAIAALGYRATKINKIINVCMYLPPRKTMLHEANYSTNFTQGTVIVYSSWIQTHSYKIITIRYHILYHYNVILFKPTIFINPLTPELNPSA